MKLSVNMDNSVSLFYIGYLVVEVLWNTHMF